MKKSVKILLIIFCVIMLAVLTSAVIFGVYYPSYALSKDVFDVSAVEYGEQIKAMSFNVRCFAVNDLFKKSWFYRSKLVLQTIADSAPDVIAFQEVTPLHEKYFNAHLKGYGFKVAYRTDKGIKEGVMVAYRLDRFSIVDEGSFWLSETPEVESKDWGTAFPRVLAYCTLKERNGDKDFTVASTHLDHVSDKAREEGMRVIIEQKQKLDWGTLILMGDMNDYDDSLMYNKAISSGLIDAQKSASETYLGSGSTYHGFGKILDGKRIDYIFVTPDASATSYKVIDVKYDEVYPSDHFPIFAQIELK